MDDRSPARQQIAKCPYSYDVVPSTYAAHMKYTREILQAAVEKSNSVIGVLRALEVSPTGGMQAHIKRRLTHFNIDTSHFKWRRSCPGQIPFGVTGEELASAVRDSIGIRGVLRRLGLPPSGSNYAKLRYHLPRLGIDTSHFKGQGRNKGDPGPRKPAAMILIRLPEGAQRAKPKPLRRALIDSGVRYVCAECGIPAEWRNKPIVLHVDHIDGDYLDCRARNLRFLCPNCHTQTWNYAGKRK